MPQDAGMKFDKGSAYEASKDRTGSASRHWFTTPQPIKRLFDKVPLHTYPPNELPHRIAGSRDENTLYIFATPAGARDGTPSFNPGCLKWQTYLRFIGVAFVTVASNNHASPSGALPFLLPSSSSPLPHSEPVLPISSNRIQRWARELTPKKTSSKAPAEANDETSTGTNNEKMIVDAPDNADMRYEAYMSLLDHRIRDAYLYSLYLSPPNFASIAAPFYINPCSANFLVRLTLGHQLRAAAESELLKQSPVIDVEMIYRESGKAFQALSALLDSRDYFFDQMKPGLFDASVFAYTHVLLGGELEWKDTRMREQLEKYHNLVEHGERIVERYFT